MNYITPFFKTGFEIMTKILTEGTAKTVDDYSTFLDYTQYELTKES